jgi:DNA-binding PadR family transcriptional regulator
MGAQGPLGEFELLVVLAVMQCGEGAYGVTIAKEMERRAGRETSRGALYVTLQRLVEKGLLASRLSGPESSRGGHRRRYYEATAEGRGAASATCAAMRRMWSGLESELGMP